MGLKSIAMTSNGIALRRKLTDLVDHGLTHLNLSLDTLDPITFGLITRRQGHDAVLQTLDLALAESRLRSVKLNVVVIKDLNENEALDFVELTKERNLSVRFIEVSVSSTRGSRCINISFTTTQVHAIHW